MRMQLDLSGMQGNRIFSLSRVARSCGAQRSKAVEPLSRPTAWLRHPVLSPCENAIALSGMRGHSPVR